MARSANDVDTFRLLKTTIEDIKRVKSRYFYGLDHKDWEFWRREVWAPDGRLIVPEANKECVGFEEDDTGVTIHFKDSTGKMCEPVRADAVKFPHPSG